MNESKYKPNILWVDQGEEFYNKIMQKWQDDIFMSLTHNDGESVVVERFIKTFRGKIFKQMLSNNNKS